MTVLTQEEIDRLFEGAETRADKANSRRSLVRCQWPFKSVPEMAPKSVPPLVKKLVPILLEKGGRCHDIKGGIHGYKGDASTGHEYEGHSKAIRDSSEHSKASFGI